MKKIEAIIRPHKLDDVKAALTECGVQGMTVSEVRGAGRHGRTVEVYRGVDYAVDFVPNIKLEVVVSSADWRRALRAILVAARTGEAGDGKIYVSTLCDAIRVRTGESAEGAL